MLRSTINRSLLYAVFFPFSNIENTNDRVSKEMKQSDVIEMESLSPGEIGIDRLKNMFYDSQGNITKECQSIITATCAGITGGFVVGGLRKTVDLPTNFIKENQATKWESTFHAKRQLQNKFSLEFFKGGIHLGLRAGAFCFLFQGASIVTYVYRGKFEIINFTTAGALTGSLFKMNMGLKGMVAGVVVGSLLGTIYGTVSKLLLYITGTEMSDLYEIHLQLMQKRRDNLKISADSYMDDEAKMFRQMYVENKVLQETANSPEQSE